MHLGKPPVGIVLFHRAVNHITYTLPTLRTSGPQNALSLCAQDGDWGIASETLLSCSILWNVRRGRSGPAPPNPLEYMKSRSGVVITNGSEMASVGSIVSPMALLAAGGGRVVEGDE